MRAPKEIDEPIDRILNLVPGQTYELNIKDSNAYDSIDRAGRKKLKKKMKFISETKDLYVSAHKNGLRECFAKYTPTNELEIIPA